MSLAFIYFIHQKCLIFLHATKNLHFLANAANSRPQLRATKTSVKAFQPFFYDSTELTISLMENYLLALCRNNLAATFFFFYFEGSLIAGANSNKVLNIYTEFFFNNKE